MEYGHVGLLALASPDAGRFRAGVGTVYLVRLAELASMATARYLPLGEPTTTMSRAPRSDDTFRREAPLSQAN